MKDPRPKQPLFGCFLTVPLGCMAFFGGALVVALGMMPVACGRLISETLEGEFQANYEGRLEVDNARLPSLYGEQRLELDLIDPGGTFVLHGRLRGPQFPVFSKPEVWGPLEIRLDRVHVRVGEEGVTNVERSFTRRSGAGPIELDFSSDSFEELLAIDVVFSIDLLRWTDTRAEDKSFELRDVSGLGRLDLRPDAHLKLSGSAAEPPVGFELVVPMRPGWPGDGSLEGLELRFELAAEELATSVADVLLHTSGALEERFGPRLRSFVLRLDKQPGEPTVVTLKEGRGQDEERLRVTGPRAAPGLEPD